MKKFVKEQKGITLIALIITIIVMMILVAVTINVALNGGLFDKAKTAKVGTQKEIEREQLLEAVLGAYNNQGSFVIGSVNLPDEMEWADDNKTAYGSNNTATPSNNGNWVATKNGNYFYIDSHGNILDKEPEQPEELSLDGTYIDFYNDEVFTISGTTLTEEGETPKNITIDTENSKFTIEGNDEDYYRYVLIKQNNQVINIVLFCCWEEDGEELGYIEGFLSRDGFTYDIDGTYEEEDNGDTLEFNPTTQKVTTGSNKGGCYDYNDEDYFGINGEYYIGDKDKITVSQDGNTIEYGGVTYTKQ